MTISLDLVRGGCPAKRPVASVYISRLRAEAAAEADRIVAEARIEADVMLADAREDAERLRRRAQDTGAEAGEHRWTEAALRLAERRDAALENLERDCVHLAVEIARRIVGTAVELDGAVVEDIVVTACAPLRRDAALVLRVGAAHAARATRFRERLGSTRTVVVEIDDSLGSSDCVADCAGVRVDARLDVQLATIERRLLSSEPRAEDA